MLMLTYGNEARQMLLDSLMLDEPILLQSIIDTIESFESKYGGSFEQTLGNKQEMNEDEMHDAADWLYLISLFPKSDNE